MDIMFTKIILEKGIKRFVQVKKDAMIKESKHLDEGAVPVKPVLIPTYPDLLKKFLKINFWMP